MSTDPTQNAPAPSKTTAHDCQILIDDQGYRWGPLSTTERRIVYDYINSWIHHHGLDSFCTKIWTKDEFIFLNKAMNEVNAYSAPRRLLNVKREIHRLYEGRLSPLAKLWKRSEWIKLEIEMGRVAEETERYPGMAIHVLVGEGGVGAAEEGAKAEEADYESGSESEKLKKTAVREPEKELILKLPVDWNRLHVRHSGQMAVLSDGEIWETSSEEVP